VRERGATIEACLTSNLQTGAVNELAAHPLPRLLDAGVPVAVCTDNTLFSDVDAPGEYRRAAALPGLAATAVETLAAYGHAAAFPRRRLSQAAWIRSGCPPRKALSLRERLGWRSLRSALASI